MPGGKIQGINKFRPNYDPYIRDELDDEDDDDVVGGFACMQMCADGTARCACGPMPRRVQVEGRRHRARGTAPDGPNRTVERWKKKSKVKHCKPCQRCVSKCGYNAEVSNPSYCTFPPDPFKKQENWLLFK